MAATPRRGPAAAAHPSALNSRSHRASLWHSPSLVILSCNHNAPSLLTGLRRRTRGFPWEGRRGRGADCRRAGKRLKSEARAQKAGLRRRSSRRSTCHYARRAERHARTKRGPTKVGFERTSGRRSFALRRKDGWHVFRSTFHCGWS